MPSEEANFYTTINIDKLSTALCKAVAEGSMDAVRSIITISYLFEIEGDINLPKILTNHPDNSGQTPLYIAIKEGHIHIVKLLLQEGSDIQEQDVEKAILNSIEYRESNPIILSLLINFIKEQDQQKMELLNMANLISNISKEEFMLLKKMILSPLDYVQQALETLIMHNPELQKLVDRLETNLELFQAIKNGQQEEVEKLIIDPDIDFTSQHFITHETPFTAAIRSGNAVIVESIAKSDKFNINSELHHGRHAFDMAVGFQNHDIVKFLIEQFPDNLRLFLQRTNFEAPSLSEPLREAIYFNKPELLSLLVNILYDKDPDLLDECLVKSKLAGENKSSLYLDDSHLIKVMLYSDNPEVTKALKILIEKNLEPKLEEELAKAQLEVVKAKQEEAASQDAKQDPPGSKPTNTEGLNVKKPHHQVSKS